jgi:hypothetical protein
MMTISVCCWQMIYTATNQNSLYFHEQSVL